MSLIDVTGFAGALGNGLRGETECLGAVALAHGAGFGGVDFASGDLVFDATGQELGECKAFCEGDGRLHALVRVFSRAARFGDLSAIWRPTEAMEVWPLEALEPAYAWHALGEEGRLMVLRN